MNCPNCSAPMQIAPGTQYLRCEYCGTHRSTESSSQPHGEVQLLQLDSPFNCPCCEQQMRKAMVGEAEVAYCIGCRGFLIESGEFADRIKRFRKKRGQRQAGSSTSVEPAPVDASLFDRIVKCPSCSDRMECHPYYGPGNVVIDSCGKCRRIWLDAGELTTIGVAVSASQQEKEESRRKKDREFEKRFAGEHDERYDRKRYKDDDYDDDDWDDDDDRDDDYKKWKRSKTKWSKPEQRGRYRSWSKFFDDFELDDLFDLFDD